MLPAAAAGESLETNTCVSPWIQQSRRIYVRPRTGPQSAHLWWPAVAKLQAARVPKQLRHGTDRWTDRAPIQVRHGTDRRTDRVPKQLRHGTDRRTDRVPRSGNITTANARARQLVVL